jgi:hypothetical protein
MKDGKLLQKVAPPEGVAAMKSLTVVGGLVVEYWLVWMARVVVMTPESKAVWTKKTKAVSKIAQSRPRKGMATMPNSIAATPLRLRAKLRNTPLRRGGSRVSFADMLPE